MSRRGKQKEKQHNQKPSCAEVHGTKKEHAQLHLHPRRMMGARLAEAVLA